MQLQKQLLHRLLCIAMWFNRRNEIHIFVFHARISLYRGAFAASKKNTHTQKQKIWQTFWNNHSNNPYHRYNEKKEMSEKRNSRLISQIETMICCGRKGYSMIYSPIKLYLFILSILMWKSGAI